MHRADGEKLARHMERDLETLSAVHWAQVNAVLGNLVVAFDPEDLEVDDIVDLVEGLEDAHGLSAERFPADRAEHPGDIEPLRRNLLAAGSDVLGIGMSAFGRLLNATPVPTEVASIVSFVEHQPRVRKVLEDRIGYAATDLGLGLSSAFVQALTQGPVGLLVSLGHRASAAWEVAGRRQLWEQREPELAGQCQVVPLAALEDEPRPVPLPQGPVEVYADRAALGSVVGFGAGLAATRSPRRAANVLLAGIPRPSSMGREVFAAHLGRALSDRDVLVLDRAVLRRLDRIDAIVFDAAVLRGTGRTIGDVEPLGDWTLDGLRGLAEETLRMEEADHVPDVRGWRLVEVKNAPALPRGTIRKAHRLAAEGSVRIAVSNEGVAGVVCVVPELHPLAASLIASARSGGFTVVVAGETDAIGARLGADRVVPGGSNLSTSIRALQNEGHAVLLISGSEHKALRASDCGVGLPGGDHPAWGAHVLARRGLEDAWFMLEATRVAQRVSRRSVLFSMAGSSIGGVWALLGPAAGAGRRVALPVSVSALAAEAAGLGAALSLRPLHAPVPQRPTPWHSMPVQEVLEAFASSGQGLSNADAAARLLPPPVSTSRPYQVASALVGEFANPLTPVLGLGAGLAAVAGSVSDAALVGSTLVANGLLGAVQRVRTEWSLERLFERTETRVSVRRGDQILQISREELVDGDLVEMVAGEVVPADCRILTASGCEVDESLLTGESLPVGKSVEPVTGKTLAERSCMLYEGTTIVAGQVSAVVVASGSRTEVGTALSGVGRPPPSGVEGRLAEITRVVIPITVAAGAIVTGIGILRGRPLNDVVSTGVSLSVAAVPEGLPLLASMAQLSAAQRLSTRSALVRNPRTIEAMGRVDVLCFDKTGTLTTGRIGVQLVSDGVEEHAVTELNPALRSVLAAAVRASPEFGDDGEALPHSTDQAVVEAAERSGVTAAYGMGEWHSMGELAFEPTRRFHAVVGAGESGTVVVVKGAPESILPRCEEWQSPTGRVLLTTRNRAQLNAAAERMAGQGLRVLAVAERKGSNRAEIDSERVSGMCLLGFLGLADQVRSTATAAVSNLRKAGVDIVMITGDHPSTARAIASDLSILNEHRVVTGAEIDAVDDAALPDFVRDVVVFARVTPAHKVRIVKALQAGGRVVAMTGDGANDAAAIRLANTGIALGRHGAPAARAAADLVVLDDRLETIIDVIVEGRSMWASVRDALAILLGGNLGEVGFIVGGTVLTGASPLNARQLLLVNALTDLLPAMAIALRSPVHRAPESLLHEGPDASLGAPLLQQIVMRAGVTAGGAGAAWLLARTSGTRSRASTVALAALVGTQLGQTAVVGGWSPVVLLATAVSSAALVGVIQTPGVSHFFGCRPLGPAGWSIAIGASAAATGASIVVPWVVRRTSAVFCDQVEVMTFHP